MNRDLLGSLKPTLNFCKQDASDEGAQLCFHQQQHQQALLDTDLIQSEQNTKCADGRIAVAVNKVQQEKAAKVGQVLDVPKDEGVAGQGWRAARGAGYGLPEGVPQALPRCDNVSFQVRKRRAGAGLETNKNKYRKSSPPQTGHEKVGSAVEV